ncbi:hypothetical protein ABW20_dc0101489 [Dactylellina cionopaga]|nr:hypothetical protein ABW20_dc0101489 [Dactylellina cionopaga]
MKLTTFLAIAISVSALPLPLEVGVDNAGCDGLELCKIDKGKELTVAGEFTANEDSKTALVEIDASVGGISIDVGV